MQISDKPALTFDDVSLKPRYCDFVSRSEVDLSWRLGTHKFELPVIASNMTTVCGEEMARAMAVLGGLGIIHRFMPVEEQLKIRENWLLFSPLAQSVGSVLNDRVRIDALLENEGADILCVDMAHGDSLHMERTLKYIRDKGFSGPIIAGNVCTKVATEALIEWGASMVKVGIGPGSVCTTRIKTGNGIPQFQSVLDCQPYPIIADGGIREPGDAAKALAAGANAVMIGGMLAGTDCVPGYDSEGDLCHAGNASSKVKHDFQQHNSNAEGVAFKVSRKGKGSTKAVIQYLAEGIRSCCSYQGARTLTQLRANAEFVRTTPAAVRENNPHFNRS